MIIDDEADQASLDVGKKGRISRINGLIGQIIKHPRALGYCLHRDAIRESVDRD